MADQSLHAWADVREIGGLGMILFRGDLSSPALETCVKTHLDLSIPGVGGIEERGEAMVGWMSPDELLFMVPEEQVPAVLGLLDTDLSGTHHLATDVSAMRMVFEICGSGVRDALAKGTPTDVAPGSFRIGQLKRSRLGQVAAAFWMRDEETVRLICRRSEAGYLGDWLHFATLEGSDPDYHSA